MAPECHILEEASWPRLVKSGERWYVEGCDDWRVNLRVRGVQAPVCKPLLSVGEYTTMESLSCMVTKVTCSTRGSNVAKKIDAWIPKEMIVQLRTKRTTCTTST